MSVSLRCYSTSLGCPKNRVDTERLLGSLGVRLVPVDAPDEADLVFINTCAFIQPATEESVRTIAQAVADIEDLPKRPLLAVAGCLVGRYHAEDLAPELPEVDLWLDNSDLEAWPAMLARKLGLPEPTVPGRILSTGPSYAWLKISDGCRHACSFCAIPNIRGGHRSHTKDMIVREARTLIDQGVKELNLVAQDVTEWGCDLDGKQDLRVLLDGLFSLSGLERLRLLYLYPAGLTHDMLKYLRDAGKPFVPYFDVPVQHSHPDILSRMGRPFARNPREVIDRIRNVFPEAALRTSIMVGFPGETEEHFEHLQAFIEEVRFQHLGVFAYRAEEGTPAAVMPDQVEDRVKEWRRDSLMEAQADISAEWLSQFEGDRRASSRVARPAHRAGMVSGSRNRRHGLRQRPRRRARRARRCRHRRMPRLRSGRSRLAGEGGRKGIEDWGGEPFSRKFPPNPTFSSSTTFDRIESPSSDCRVGGLRDGALRNKKGEEMSSPFRLLFHFKSGCDEFRRGDGPTPENMERAVFQPFDEGGGQAPGGGRRFVEDAPDRDEEFLVELTGADHGGRSADVRAAGGDGLAHGLRERAGYGMRGKAHRDAPGSAGEDVGHAEPRREKHRKRAGPEAFQKRHEFVRDLGDHVELFPVAEDQGQRAHRGTVLGAVDARGGVGVEGAASERKEGFRRKDDGMPVKHEFRREFQVDVGRCADVVGL